GLGIQPGLLQIYCGASTGAVAFGYGSSGAFTESMRVMGNGNVGIGNKNPGFLLDVAGRARIEGGGGGGGRLWFSDPGSPTTNASFVGRAGDGAPWTGVYSSALNNWTLIARDSGYVGIGTTNPAAPLHVAAPQGIILGTNPSSGGYTGLQIGL